MKKAPPAAAVSPVPAMPAWAGRIGARGGLMNRQFVKKFFQPRHFQVGYRPGGRELTRAPRQAGDLYRRLVGRYQPPAQRIQRRFAEATQRADKWQPLDLALPAPVAGPVQGARPEAAQLPPGIPYVQPPAGSLPSMPRPAASLPGRGQVIPRKEDDPDFAPNKAARQGKPEAVTAPKLNASHRLFSRVEEVAPGREATPGAAAPQPAGPTPAAPGKPAGNAARPASVPPATLQREMAAPQPPHSATPPVHTAKPPLAAPAVASRPAEEQAKNLSPESPLQPPDQGEPAVAAAPFLTEQAPTEQVLPVQALPGQALPERAHPLPTQDAPVRQAPATTPAATEAQTPRIAPLEIPAAGKPAPRPGIVRRETTPAEPRPTPPPMASRPAVMAVPSIAPIDSPTPARMAAHPVAPPVKPAQPGLVQREFVRAARPPAARACARIPLGAQRIPPPAWNAARPVSASRPAAPVLGRRTQPPLPNAAPLPPPPFIASGVYLAPDDPNEPPASLPPAYAAFPESTSPEPRPTPVASPRFAPARPGTQGPSRAGPYRAGDSAVYLTPPDDSPVPPTMLTPPRPGATGAYTAFPGSPSTEPPDTPALPSAPLPGQSAVYGAFPELPMPMAGSRPSSPRGTTPSAYSYFGAGEPSVPPADAGQVFPPEIPEGYTDGNHDQPYLGGYSDGNHDSSGTYTRPDPGGYSDGNHASGQQPPAQPYLQAQESPMPGGQAQDDATMDESLALGEVLALEEVHVPGKAPAQEGAPSAADALDIDQIARQVYPVILRRLRVERERQGAGRR